MGINELNTFIIREVTAQHHQNVTMSICTAASITAFVSSVLAEVFFCLYVIEMFLYDSFIPLTPPKAPPPYNKT